MQRRLRSRRPHGLALVASGSLFLLGTSFYLSSRTGKPSDNHTFPLQDRDHTGQNSVSLATAINLTAWLLKQEWVPLTPGTVQDWDFAKFDIPSVVTQYDILPANCSFYPNDQFLIIGVISRPAGFKFRQAIRKTWASVASPVCGVRVVFVLGRIYDVELQNKLVTESNIYKDLLQSNQFDDVYRASTAKTLQFLQWSAAFCSESKYTVRIDDDNWLNLPKYYNFIKDNWFKEYVFGTIFAANNTVLRNPLNKYYVPREEYRDDKYTEYLSGMMFAFPTKHIHRILIASTLHIPATFLDDVFVAGVLTDAANLTRGEVPDYSWDPRIKESNCPKRDRMCVHYSNEEDFYRMWKDKCHRYSDLC